MHNQWCVRSEGDWLCSPACTHDRDEAALQAKTTQTKVTQVLSIIDTNIAIQVARADLGGIDKELASYAVGVLASVRAAIVKQES